MNYFHLLPPLTSSRSRNAVAPVAAAVLAIGFCGCAGNDPSSTSVAGGSADPSATHSGRDPGLKVRPTPKDLVAHTSSGKVGLKPVTPEEYKKLVAEQKGKVVLVDFWATWCAPCRANFPKTLALAQKYGSQGLTVVSVSMDSPERSDQEKALRFLRDQNAQITNLANRMEDTDAAFGAFGIDGGALPHYKVFDRNGKPAAKFGGDPDHPFDEKDIEKAVVAALQKQ